MNELTLTPVPAFKDNYIWLLDNGRQALAVDPGEAAPLEKALAERSLQLTTLLITHHHHDHTGGIAELAARHALQVIGPSDPAQRITGLNQEVSDEARFEVLGLQLRVITVPGHTLDHIAFFAPAQSGLASPLLFCGDTLFSGGCGRLFEGTPAQMHRSLQRLAALPADTLICCAHEYTASNLQYALALTPDDQAVQARSEEVSALRQRHQATLPSRMAAELRFNPFLRCDQRSLHRIAETMCQRPLQSEVEVFAALRAGKDQYSPGSSLPSL